MDQANEAIQDGIATEQPMLEVAETQEDITEEVSETETNEGEALLEPKEPEFVNVEYEGNEYNLPPELKEALMRQQDYTSKTQSVADERKALEQQTAQFQQAAEMQQRNMQGHAQYAALQNQLQQYQNVDWDSFSENDPTAAQKAFFQYTQLKDATTNLGNQLQSQESQALQSQQMNSAKQLEQGSAELARDVKGWGTERKQALNAHGETYGFTHTELNQIADPRMVKVLNDAYLYRQSLSKAKATPETLITPITKVKGKGKGQPNPDKMSTDDWMKWRNKQVNSR